MLLDLSDKLVSLTFTNFVGLTPLIPQNHGYCKEGKKCPKSHNVDEAIISHDHKSKKHKTEGKVPPIKSKHSNGDAVDTGCHRAGVDAFMTGN